MIRLPSRFAALHFAAALAVDGHVTPEKADGLAILKENPPCGTCGGRTFYHAGRHGARWRCEGGDGWTENVGRSNWKAHKPPDPRVAIATQAPPCPICGAATWKRQGRYGEFWGCGSYPNCKGIAK